MRAITFIVMAVFMMTAYAQKSPVEKFIKKQSKTDYIKVEEIDVNSKEFTAEMKLDGKAEEILAQVEMIKILTSDSTATSSDKANFMDKAKDALDDERYTELAVVRSDGDDVGLYAYPMDDGKIREMVVLVGGDDNTLLVYMKGKLDMSTALSSEIFSGMLGANKGKDCD
jgi:hypothetical protein